MYDDEHNFYFLNSKPKKKKTKQEKVQLIFHTNGKIIETSL